MQIDPAFWAVLVLNLPLVVAFFYALQAGWLYTGRSHNEAMKSRDDEIHLREQLRQEALVDQKESDARLDKLGTQLKEATDVMGRGLDFAERLVGTRADRGSPSRTRVRARPPLGNPKTSR